MKLRIDAEGTSWVTTFSSNDGVIMTMIVDKDKYDETDIRFMVEQLLDTAKSWKR